MEFKRAARLAGAVNVRRWIDLQHELHQLLILIMDTESTTHNDVVDNAVGFLKFHVSWYKMTRVRVCHWVAWADVGTFNDGNRMRHLDFACRLQSRWGLLVPFKDGELQKLK